MPDDQNTTQNEPSTDSSPTSLSYTPETAPEAPEAPQDDFGAESINSAINKGDAGINQPENESKTQENLGNMDSPNSEPQTAQTPENEPLPEQPEPIQNQSKPSLAHQLLISARNAIQFRKRKKLDKIMALFLQHSKITNDEVEKYLHVSDATATRYLSTLEKEGRIKQDGKTGKGVSYSRI